MEEFTKDQPVSDEERRLAEARKLTLNPLHIDVQPEEIPGLDALASERATRTQANITNDNEDTANEDQLLTQVSHPLAHKTILHNAPSRKILTTVIVVAIIIVMLIAAFFWFIEIH